MNIAIDGPSGSGKSTIAKILAKKLHIAYLDTGAMYRAIAYYALEKGADVSDEKTVLPLLEGMEMKVWEENGVQQVEVNGINTTPFIRENKISMAASTVSKIPAVRLKLVELQREIAKKTDCVLDGRDIGSYVLPNADYKFYMTADTAVRAQRRHDELLLKGQDIPVETLIDELEKRDLQDKTRSFAPLVICKDAVVVDTTKMTIDQVSDYICGIVCK